MRSRYQEKATKTAILLALANLVTVPTYLLFGRTAGFITSCAMTFGTLKVFHDAGTSIHGRAFGNLRDRGVTFFTNDAGVKLENTAKNIVTGGEVHFDSIANSLKPQ